MKKILNKINIITVCIPLFFFFFYLCLLLWHGLGHMVNILSQRIKNDIEYLISLLSLNFMLYSAIFAIPISIILTCVRLILLKEKINLSFIMFIIMETVLFVMILFNVGNMYAYAFGD